MEARIKDEISKIRPFLQRDGGDVDFVEMTGNVVKVRLKGACGSCPGAMMTLKGGIERALREKVSQEISVERVD